MPMRPRARSRALTRGKAMSIAFPQVGTGAFWRNEPNGKRSSCKRVLTESRKLGRTPHFTSVRLAAPLDPGPIVDLTLVGRPVPARGVVGEGPYAAVFRGRPPSLPLAREAATLARVLAWPPRSPSRAAIQLLEPRKPSSKAGR
jgi:hypothetical protein